MRSAEMLGGGWSDPPALQYISPPDGMGHPLSENLRISFTQIVQTRNLSFSSQLVPFMLEF